MTKLTLKIAIPVILVGIFSISVFIALEYERLGISFYIVIILLTLFMFFFGFATGQNLSSPVKKLLERATELSEGNLSSRVYLETKDEFSELAKAFNKIADNLQQSHQQEATTEQSVDIKVRARTQALEETINALEQKIKNRTVELERLVKESSKLQEESKSKEAEALLLKRELGSFKQKLGKYSKPKPPLGNKKEIKNNI